MYKNKKNRAGVFNGFYSVVSVYDMENIRIEKTDT
jgi:hypothetical protein